MIRGKISLPIAVLLMLCGCKRSEVVKPQIVEPSSSLSVASPSWQKLGNFGGDGRAAAFGFVIADKGYVLGGHTGLGEPTVYLNDLWEYNPATDKWTQKADYPGQASDYIRGFVIDNKAYVGTGYGQKDHLPNALPDSREFYQYDPLTNKWTKKAAFAGAARENGIAFEIDGIGYLGMGTDFFSKKLYKDVWKYNSVADKWTRVANYPGKGVYAASYFSCNRKGYVGMGQTAFNVFYDDFWQYDPSTNKWLQKADFIGGGRGSTAQFVIGTDAYVGCGASLASAFTRDMYAYDVLTDKWTKSLPFPGIARSNLVSFAIDRIGYIGTGSAQEYKDFWKFKP